MRRDLVVIGTSSGGIEALQAIVSALPERFPASICIVLHTAPDSPGILHDILRRAGRLPVRVVRSSERIEPSTIYLPPPDQHLIVEPSRLRVTRGPRENRFRPAIDPLFRSAAQVYGPRVIGVI
jgi:two-component system chemotaxis response regulator CheB